MTQTTFALSLSTSGTSNPTRLGRRLLTAGLATIGITVGLFVAAHEVPVLGPLAADTLRDVIGVDGVARLEDAAYSVKDAIDQLTRKGEAPKAYWQIPDPAAPSLDDRVLAALTPALDVDALVAPWSPAPTAIPFLEVAAPGDGVWVHMNDAGTGTEMRKTLLHPDPGRTWAELFVVAIDLEVAALNWVPGRIEPQNAAPGADELLRPARIPQEARERLLAAFNGGFKTQHGQFGARADGIDLVPPRPRQCTLGQTSSGDLVLGTYEDLPGKNELIWLRQTPGCMLERGKLHPQLTSETNTNWGATLDGGTVIRRSAIGLSEDERTLYVGISNDTTARALALGMQAAGAHTVAQLDVNYAYPKFITYEEKPDGLTARTLAPGFVFHDAQYLESEARDFFYLTRK